jgi:diguanylate cyclase (GGDEF)-like protein
MRLTDFLAHLERQSPAFWGVIGFFLILLLGVVDYVSGSEIAFSLFYLIPVAVLAWFTGRGWGMVGCIISAVVWGIADYAAGQIYSHAAIYYWNTGIRLSFFVIVTLLLTALRETLEHEKALARTDALTGAMNSRSFLELAQVEMERARRRPAPFTVLYLDIDNFKAINDRLGHAAGDDVLCAVVQSLRSHLRKTDTIARCGGDEFACLLPETDEEATAAVVRKIQQTLSREVTACDWPVTFSAGVITCMDVPETADSMIKLADNLMYEAKSDGKNRVRSAVYRGHELMA